MASKGIKLLSCATLLMGTLGGLLSRQDNRLEQSEVFNHWESQLSEGEVFTLYSKQEAKVENYIEATFKNGHIESIKTMEDNFIYLISEVEEKSLENGDYGKVKTYYTLTFPKVDEGVLENGPKERIKVEKLQHLYMSQAVPIAYIDEMSPLESEEIKALLNVVFSKDRRFWEVYEEKWLEGFRAWENFLREAPLLGSKLSVQEATYREDYGQILNDSFSREELIPKWDEMAYEAMPYTTKNNHFFAIKIPVQVLREGDNGLYYNYHYLVGTSGNNIVSLKFLRREPLKENTF